MGISAAQLQILMGLHIRVPAEFVKDFEVTKAWAKGRTRNIHYHHKGFWLLHYKGELVSEEPTQKAVRKKIKEKYLESLAERKVFTALLRN